MARINKKGIEVKVISIELERDLIEPYQELLAEQGFSLTARLRTLIKKDTEILSK